MKFFLDANIPYSTVNIFKKFGEAEHARDVGLSGASDKEIISYAVKHNAILVTKDLEFGNTSIYTKESHFGVIVLRLPFYFTAMQINKHLNEFLNSVNIDELKNSIAIVELRRYRIRK